jgi:hypothetical protein
MRRSIKFSYVIELMKHLMGLEKHLAMTKNQAIPQFFFDKNTYIKLKQQSYRKVLRKRN